VSLKHCLVGTLVLFFMATRVSDACPATASPNDIYEGDVRLFDFLPGAWGGTPLNYVQWRRGGSIVGNSLIQYDPPGHYTAINIAFPTYGNNTAIQAIVLQPGGSSCTTFIDVLRQPGATIDNILGVQQNSVSLTFNGTGVVDSSKTGQATYVWNFGDGNTAQGQSATHAYNLPGTYTVTFTVSDGTRTDVASQQLTISSNPNVPGQPSGLNAQFIGCNGFGIGNFSISWSPTGTQPSNYYAYQFRPGGATSWPAVQFLTTTTKTEGVNGLLTNRVRVRGCVSASESTCGPSSEKSFYSVNCSGGGGEPD